MKRVKKAISVAVRKKPFGKTWGKIRKWGAASVKKYKIVSEEDV